MTAPLFLVHNGLATPLSNGAVAIGRLEECQVVLDGREVSRRHARIVATPEGPLLVDRSRFGTEVNGSRLAAPALLRDGDLVGVGDYSLAVTARPWDLGAEPVVAALGTGWRVRVAAWRRRYGPTEALGAAVAVGVALGSRAAGAGLPLAAFAATLTEACWFYGTLAWRDLRRERSEAAERGSDLPPAVARAVVRDLVLEFGAAEAVDSLVLRPICYAAGMHWLGTVPGILAGKIVADLLFWGPVLSVCHWRFGARPVPQPSPDRSRSTTSTRPLIRRD